MTLNIAQAYEATVALAFLACAVWAYFDLRSRGTPSDYPLADLVVESALFAVFWPAWLGILAFLIVAEWNRTRAAARQRHVAGNRENRR